MPRLSKAAQAGEVSYFKLVCEKVVKYGEKAQIRSSLDAREIFNGQFQNFYEQEEFLIAVLNRTNKVEAVFSVSLGGNSATVVDSKCVFRRALAIPNAAAIICCHNHPSGNPNPSGADIDLTKKLKAAGEVLDILVLDHIIIAPIYETHIEGATCYTSFADEGLI